MILIYKVEYDFIHSYQVFSLFNLVSLTKLSILQKYYDHLINRL